MKTLRLALVLAVTLASIVPAMAAEPSPAPQVNNPAPDFPYGFTPTNYSQRSTFAIYTVDANGDQHVSDAGSAVNLLVDAQTGQQYIVLVVPGQPPAITPRLGSEYIPFCQTQNGFDCQQKNGPVGSSGPDRRLLTHERAMFEWTQALVAAFQNLFTPGPTIEKKN